MPIRSIRTKGRSIDELLPVIEDWLLTNGYQVSVIANRIDATSAEKRLRIFLKDYSSGCVLQIYSDTKFSESLKRYLARQHLLSYTVNCPYCNSTFDITKSKCPTCGAPFTIEG